MVGFKVTTIEEIEQKLRDLFGKYGYLKGELNTMKGRLSVLEDLYPILVGVSKGVTQKNGRERMYQIVILILSIVLVILSYITGVKVNGST